MKKTVVLLLTFLLFFSCSPQKNSENFIKEFSGRYLFNANEVIEIYFKNNELFIKWRGDENIRPLKVNDSTFYMKELNEKIIFISKPNVHIELAEKVEHKGEKYFFKKLKQNEKTPLELVESGEFDKALQAYLKIKKQDSLNLSISRSTINKLGYSFLRKNQNKKAIEIFKINCIILI
ncbi:hypothetical protein [Polaribacter tangerinus]|uniref:hypothetical protein n=1 Tax=Polaribacter tangerinus TaxID=1920034 RepID=UPI000B4BED06|nr:hypothetical protein [Polaribacter tangerinus]